MQQDKFSFFIPLEIEKSGSGEGRYDNMRFKGIASNPNKGLDKEGQWLDPSGFDLNDFIKGGTFNWHHRWKDKPTAIVGEPTKASVTKNNELYVEGVLYKSSQVARDIYDLAETLQNDSPNRRIGMSIEGIPTMIDPKNKNRILKARLTNIALTPSPICPGTSMELMKGGLEELKFEEKDELLIDITDEHGTRWTVDKNLQLEKSEKIEGLEKGGPGSGKYVHLQNGHKFASKGHGMKYGAAQQQTMREAQDHYKKHAESLSDHELVEDHTNASAGSMHQGAIARELHKRANQHLQDEHNKNRTEGHPPTIHDIEHAKKVLLSKKQIEKSFDDEIEKGGLGSGRKKIKVNSIMASHSNLHGKTFDVHKESEYEFASGKKKYYHIKDDDGDEHEIREDFAEVQKAMSAGSITGTETHNQSLTQEPLKQESIAGAEGEKKKKKDYKKLLENMRKRRGDKDPVIDLMSKAEVDEILTDLELSDEEKLEVFELAQEIEKGGEGSRGGKVIGHTKSGKPIYDSSDHKSHSDFNEQDHRDASDIHNQKAHDAYSIFGLKEGKRQEITRQQEIDAHKTHEHHWNQMQGHFSASQKLKSARKNAERESKGKKAIYGEAGRENRKELFGRKKIKKGSEEGDIELEKAGEGSRGGKVIGHTKSGKPIYDSAKKGKSSGNRGVRDEKIQDELDSIIEGAGWATDNYIMNFSEGLTKKEKYHLMYRLAQKGLLYNEEDLSEDEATGSAIPGKIAKMTTKDVDFIYGKSYMNKAEILTSLLSEHNLDIESAKYVYQLAEAIEKGGVGSGRHKGMKLKPISEDERRNNEKSGKSFDSERDSHPIYSKVEKFMERFPDKPKSWKDATGELADIHATMADEYNSDKDEKDKYKAHEGYSRTPEESNKRHKEGIKHLLGKLTNRQKSNVESAKRVWELTKAIDLSKLVRKQITVQGKDGRTYTTTRWVDPNTGSSPVHSKQSSDIAEKSGHDDKAVAKVAEIIASDDLGKVQKVRDLIGLGIYDKKQLMLLADCTYAIPYSELKDLGGITGDLEGGGSTVPRGEVGSADGSGEVSTDTGEIATEGLSEKKLKKILDQQRAKKRSESGLSYKDFWNSYESTLKGVIVDGYPKSLIAYGTGGLGKTYTLDTVMEELGVRKFDPEINPSHEQYDAVIIKGGTGIRDMWSIICDNKDKLIVFDDCDSMWKGGDDNPAQNILKGMLDTSGDGSVRYGNAGKDADGVQLPKQIRFTGQVVFISNLQREDFPQPLISSRCAAIDLTMTKDETMDKLNDIKGAIKVRGKNEVAVDISQESRNAAYDFIKKHKNQLDLGQINGRTFAQIAQIHNRLSKEGLVDRFENEAMIRMNLV